MVTYVKTEQEGDMLLLNGYTYRTDHKYFNKTAWRKGLARGLAYIVNNEVNETLGGGGGVTSTPVCPDVCAQKGRTIGSFLVSSE